MKHKEQGLVVLGLNPSDDRRIALDHLKANHVTFPNILDTSSAGYKALSQYETLGMTTVPMTYVIDRGGKVVDAWYGYRADRTKQALRKLGL